MDNNKLISLLQQIKDLVEESIAILKGSAKHQRVAKNPTIPLHALKPTSLDFDKPMRPFIKQYAKGMSGPKKFTLLLSRLVKGNLKQEITLEEIEKNWNKMKSEDLLGMDFNRSFAGRAKNNDWVDSNRRGVYNLRPSWMAILKGFNG